MKKLAVFVLAVSLLFGTGCSLMAISDEPAPVAKAKGLDNPIYDLDTLPCFPFVKETIEWGTSYKETKQQLSTYVLACEENRITVMNPRTALKQDTVAYLFFFEKNQLTSAAILFDDNASVKTVKQHLLSRFGDPASDESGDCTWSGTGAELCLRMPKEEAGMMLWLRPVTAPVKN